MDHIFSNCNRKMHVLKLVTNSKKCKYNAIDIKQDKETINMMIDQLIVMEGQEINGEQQYATLLEIFLRNQHNTLN
jgi:ABC-type dipeptide/oligopeptide/nickel transport system ATPase subunit